MHKNYFDYAASSPPYEEVLDEYVTAASRFFGNPSSAHYPGIEARECLKKIRREIGLLCGFNSGYTLFTSGGTEANNLVIRGIMERYPEKRLLLAADVHASCWFATDTYADRVDILPIEKNGLVSKKKLENLCTHKTVLCSIVLGNNETGVVQNVLEMGAYLQSRGILFHCDGVQMLGHIPGHLDVVPFDFYTFSAHKFGGLRGCGGIFTRSSDLCPQIVGGGQEMNMRGGTENIAGVAATLKALQIACQTAVEEEKRLRSLSNFLVDHICSKLPDTVVNSNLNQGIPGLISLSFPHVKGNEIVTALNLSDFYVSFGSACHSGEVVPSRVMVSMGVPYVLAIGTVRISFGRYTDENQVDALAKALVALVEKQRV